MLISKRSFILGAGAAFITRDASAAIYLRQNPLRYPGGIPSVNPNHPASKALRISVCASEANGGVGLISPMGNTLATASALTAATTRTGPGVSITGVNYINATGPSNFGTGYVTIAAIFWTPTSFSNYSCIAYSAGSNVALYVRITDGVVYFYNGTASVVSSITVQTNRPYFIVFTVGSALAPLANYSFVVRDLLTGVVQTSSVIASPTGIGYSTFTFGNNLIGPYPLVGAFNAGMVGGAQVNLSEALAWAQRPWDFWYSTAELDLMASALPSGGGGLARLRALIGVGN